MSLIELAGVSKTFVDQGPKTTALTDITLQIEAGEFVAIMGTSGSGKSTLMNIIGLLDVPSEGTYRLEDRDVSRLKPRELAKIRRQKIGFIFQNFNLIPRLTIKQNVELPLIYGGKSANERRQKVASLLQSVGLADRGDYKPNQISGGQVQRAAIARALANNPAVILADEPTGNLDSKTAKTIMQELQALNAKGVTVILVTHDKEVAGWAKRVITIKDGQVAK